MLFEQRFDTWNSWIYVESNKFIFLFISELATLILEINKAY